MLYDFDGVKDFLKKRSDEKNDISVKYNEPLSHHTSFKIGGECDLFLSPHNSEALLCTVSNLKQNRIPYYILGNGSNVLFSDSGYRGAVVSLAKMNEIKVDGEKITAESGASLNTVCKTAASSSLKGLEFAYGIPGSVGGAVFMNAGAYGGEISSVLSESKYLDLADMTVHILPREEHCFSYRFSTYKKTNRIILSATFALEKGDGEKIKSLMTELMNRRISKQPLEYPSAGSVFKRPEGHYVGQMIEELGLKGFSVGSAAISEKHAGFIINRGGARAEDVLVLIEIIKEKVYKSYGCELECEIIYVK